MNNRIEKIKELKSKGLTLEQIGAKLKPPISGERVRQILSPKKSYFKRIPVKVIKDDYSKLLLTISKKQLFVEIKRLSSQDRSKELVIQRKLLVKKLHDEYYYSLSKIAELLEKDRSSIAYLYYSKI